MEVRNRKDVPIEETWDLSLIFAEERQMWEELERTKAEVETVAKTYRGQLATAEMIVQCLTEQEEIYKAISRIGAYADLALEVDYTDNALRAREEKVRGELTRMQSELTFVDNEILAAPQKELEEAVELANGCRRYLEDLLRRKPHMLSAETERALATLSRSFEVPYTVYNTMKLADISFPSFVVDGKEYPLGYSLYEDVYSYETDTNVRRAAFRAFSDTLAGYRHTTAAAYNACVMQDKTMSELRGFANVFDSLLFGQKVTREMYDRQIDLITEHLAPAMRRYARLLGKKHQLDKVTFADLKMPLDPEYSPPVTRE